MIRITAITIGKLVNRCQGRIHANAIDANASVTKKLLMHESVRFLPQIIRNNTFLRNTGLMMHKFQQIYFFLEMSTKHILKFTSERFVLPKTLILPPLIYTAMFQNLLFNNIKNELHLRFCIYFRKCMY